MTTQERIELIQKRKQKDDEAKNNAIRERDEKIEKLSRDIKALAPRISALLAVAQELFASRIPFGHVIESGVYEGKEEFVTDGIFHSIGFVVKYFDGYYHSPKEIGIEGGGCCGHDFYVDCKGDIVESSIMRFGMKKSYQYDPASDFIGKASGFIRSFDEFERKFYKYVDAL